MARPTLSDKEGNPAHAFRQRYQEFMAMEDPVRLHDEALKVIFSFLGKGISAKNVMRFRWDISKIKDNVPQMRGFISNYILAADGDSVIKR